MPNTAENLIPAVHEVRQGIWAVPIRMPEQLPYSLCYLIEDGEGSLHVVDPGWDSDENWRALTEDLAALGRTTGDVASIVVTHLHRDHVAAAGRLAEASGAPVLMHRVEAAALERQGSEQERIPPSRFVDWGVPGDRRTELVEAAARHRDSDVRGPDRVLDDGDELAIPGRSITVLWTPGHTSGHICLREEREKLLFTGDHVLPSIFSGIGLGGRSDTNPIADYLGSLERVAIFDDHEALPGHEAPFTGLSHRAGTVAEHHLTRSRQVRRVLDGAAEPTIWDVASQLTWTAGWENLSGFMLLSALAQTELHVDFVRSETALRYL